MADEEDIEEEVVQGPPPSKLVFVNHVDSYTGSSIAKVLTFISFRSATQITVHGIFSMEEVGRRVTVLLTKI